MMKQLEELRTIVRQAVVRQLGLRAYVYSLNVLLDLAHNPTSADGTIPERVWLLARQTADYGISFVRHLEQLRKATEEP